MRHRSNTTSYGWVKLVKKTNPKTGRKHYSVIIDPYALLGAYPGLTGPELKDVRSNIRQHFDPGSNRGMKTGLSFKFTNREQAEQLITLALLKWGAGNVAN